MVAGILQGLKSAIFFIVPRRIWPERVLRQPSNRNRKLEGGNRADLFADESNAFPLDLTDGALDPGLEHYEAAGHLTLERIGNANHRTFRHILCALSTSSMPPVESRWPATLMMSSVRLMT
jgi:hypothetical protein